MRFVPRAAILLALLVTIGPAAVPPSSALTGDDMHYNAISGVPFAEISTNETGESPYLLNITAWGLRADGEHEAIVRSDQVREDTFAVMFRWSENNDRHLDCWGGQRNTSKLGWKEVSGATSHNLPLGCLVAPDDLHLASGTTIWAMDATFHFRLNPQNGTEVFDHFERTQVAIFNKIQIDITEDQPRQIHQFTIRPSDWNLWLDEAGLTSTTSTQSAEPAQASTPGLVVASTVGILGLAAVALARRRGRSGERR